MFKSKGVKRSLEVLKKKRADVQKQFEALDKEYKSLISRGLSPSEPLLNNWLNVKTQLQVLEEMISKAEQELPDAIREDAKTLGKWHNRLKSEKPKIQAFLRKILAWKEKLEALRNEAIELKEEFEKEFDLFREFYGLGNISELPIRLYDLPWPWQVPMPSYDVDSIKRHIELLDRAEEKLAEKKKTLEKELTALQG